MGYNQAHVHVFRVLNPYKLTPSVLSLSERVTPLTNDHVQVLACRYFMYGWLTGSS